MKTFFVSIFEKIEEKKEEKNRHDWFDEYTVSTTMMKSHDQSEISWTITRNIMIINNIEVFLKN